MKPFLPLLAVLMSALTAADLPVRDVVLYKHGVAYFGRAGDLKAGETAQLAFKSAEMNDVLKSLTVSDGAGGKVSAVRYDSAEPLDRKLAEFPVRVAANQPLSGFLDQMRGTAVVLKYGTETVSGTIVSARLVSGDKDRSEKEQLTLLLTSGDLRTIDLGGVASVHFSDPAVEQQLKAYLGAVSQERSTDRRNVYIDSTGTAARRISASYMIPAPVWKSSYRLIFEGAVATLEGWAIVDNTTADDWNNVRLALVSGRPVSFLSHLYEPRYRQRQFVDLAEEQGVAPVVYQGAMDTREMAVVAAVPSAIPGSLGSGRGGVVGGVYKNELMRMKAAPSQAQVNTAGREIGDLFEYSFASPVTIRRGQSAMLPFLQDKITTRKLLIYSGNGSNPMNAAEITNSTGKTLDGGPITVYDGGAYGGEALVETLKVGDKRLISYAVDLGTRVATTSGSEREQVREIHFSRGMLSTKTANEETENYTIHNVDQKAKTLIIEHPLRYGVKLLNQKPSETTSTAYRFEVKLAPGATVEFPVQEESILENSTAVRGLTPDDILIYIQNRSLPAAAKRALQQIADMKMAITAADAEIAGLQAQTTEAERDQSRFRQNIESLNRVSGQESQVQQYSRQLAASEVRLATLRDQLNAQRSKKDSLIAAMNKLIDSTTF